MNSLFLSASIGVISVILSISSAHAESRTYTCAHKIASANFGRMEKPDLAGWVDVAQVAYTQALGACSDLGSPGSRVEILAAVSRDAEKAFDFKSFVYEAPVTKLVEMLFDAQCREWLKSVERCQPLIMSTGDLQWYWDLLVSGKLPGISDWLEAARKWQAKEKIVCGSWFDGDFARFAECQVTLVQSGTQTLGFVGFVIIKIENNNSTLFGSWYTESTFWTGRPMQSVHMRDFLFDSSSGEGRRR